jgi:hypothetical protein
VLDDLANLPGVESVAAASSVPLAIDQSSTSIWPESATDLRPRDAIETIYYDVSPKYFATVGTRLVDGREFTDRDNEFATQVAIINETLARKLFGRTDIAGRRIRSGQDKIQVIGVARDGKYETLTENPKPAIWYPIAQAYSSNVVLIVRSRRVESEMAGEIQAVIARLDSHVPVYGAGSLTQLQRLVYLPVQAAVTMLGSFGLLAIMLAVTGVYGLAAYTVSRRRREIGIRLAIGAAPRHVLRTVFGRTAVLVGIGAAVGLGAGAATSALLASIVYQASSRDPGVIGAAVILMAAVAIAAAFGPARRALKLDPAQTLRFE